jgi:hypothetical protein
VWGLVAVSSKRTRTKQNKTKNKKTENNMSLISVFEGSSLLRVFFAVCVRIVTQINKMYCRLIW